MAHLETREFKECHIPEVSVGEAQKSVVFPKIWNVGSLDS